MKKTINKIKCHFDFHDTKGCELINGWFGRFERSWAAECKNCGKLIYKKGMKNEQSRRKIEQHRDAIESKYELDALDLNY